MGSWMRWREGTLARPRQDLDQGKIYSSPPSANAAVHRVRDVMEIAPEKFPNAVTRIAFVGLLMAT
jgi:hypothetical protein